MDIEKLKQKILDLAIKGKLVPQDPNDEPASVLIEKIREEKAKLVKEGKIKASKEESYIYKGSDNCYYENIPKNWGEVALGELISLKSGVDLALNQINTECKGLPYLTGASCFKDNSIEVVRWTETPSNISNKGDILITVKGTIGELSFNDIGDVHIARQIMALKINKLINPWFIYFVLMSQKNYLIEKSSSLIPGIRRENILEFKILIPPRNEQEKIVDLIKNVNKKIETIKNDYTQICGFVNLFKKQLLESIFGINSSYKSYYENKTSILNDVEILDHLRKPINADERSVRIANAKKLYPYYGATGQTGVIDDYLIDGEYVLLGEDGAPFLDKHSEKAYLINGKAWVNNHAHILQSKTSNKFLLYYLNWFNYKEYVSGTTRLKLNQGMLKKIPFPDIPSSLKEKIVCYIESAFEILKLIN